MCIHKSKQENPIVCHSLSHIIVEDPFRLKKFKAPYTERVKSKCTFMLIFIDNNTIDSLSITVQQILSKFFDLLFNIVNCSFVNKTDMIKLWDLH